jgi:hypothetical protein
LKRPRLQEVYALPGTPPAGDVWCHEIRAVEESGFAIEEYAGAIVHGDWIRARPHRATPLAWNLRKDSADIRLTNPSEGRLTTKWPAFLPSPLFNLKLDETARIDWNGRLRMSAGGSNGSYYYEQHTYWLALAETPAPTLFLDLTPKKHVDLRAGIY